MKYVHFCKRLQKIHLNFTVFITLDWIPNHKETFPIYEDGFISLCVCVCVFHMCVAGRVVEERIYGTV